MGDTELGREGWDRTAREMIMKGHSHQEVIDTLKHEGCPSELAAEIGMDCENFRALRNRKSAIKESLLGLVYIILGVALGIVWYSFFSRPGLGSFGVAAYGLWKLCKGVYSCFTYHASDLDAIATLPNNNMMEE